MKALNSCIKINSQAINRLLIPTRYWEICKLSEEKSLLLNLLTGAVDLVNNNESVIIQEFLNGKISTTPTTLRKKLEGRGYISNPQAEDLFINELADKYESQIINKPLEFFICPTFFCPVRCSYCFEDGNTVHSQSDIITSSQIKHAFKGIEDICRLQSRLIKEVVLFGGEPLLPSTKQAVRAILEEASRRNYKVSVCTSGVFVEDFVDLFQEFSNSISVVRITIDGTKEHHNALRLFPNAFEKAVAGVDSLLNVNVPVMTRTNINKDNLYTIPAMANYFEKKGWFKSNIFDAVITGVKNRNCSGNKKQVFREDELAVKILKMMSSNKNVRKLRPVNIFMSLRHFASNLGHLNKILGLEKSKSPLETIKFHGCGALDGSLFVFGVDSHIYTCTEVLDKQQFSAGTYSPQLVLNNERVNKWKGWHKYKIPQCRKCKYLLVCGGTCTMTSVIKFGSGNKPVCPPVSSIISNYLSALSDKIILKK